MMVMDFEGPAHARGDKKLVLANTKVPEYPPKNKCSLLAHHLIRGGVALDEWSTTYANSNDNEVDLLTKLLLKNSRTENYSLTD